HDIGFQRHPASWTNNGIHWQLGLQWFNNRYISDKTVKAFVLISVQPHFEFPGMRKCKGWTRQV
ncbi:MAG: hypothetical protein RL712_1157, partial [Bacteroidota bacterium]